jgi:hypothetical protein
LCLGSLITSSNNQLFTVDISGAIPQNTVPSKKRGDIMISFLLSGPRPKAIPLLGLFLAICSLLPSIWVRTSFAQQETTPTTLSSEFVAGEKEQVRFPGSPGLFEIPDRDALDELTDGDSWNMDFVGRWIGGGCTSIAVKDSIVYAGVTGGLIVLDFSSTEVPVELTRYAVPGLSLGIIIRGQYAYIANGSAGLRVIDISDPAAPLEAGFYDTGGKAMDVVVSGDYAYVADYFEGLRVINISNPEDPWEEGFFDTGDRAHGVAVAGNYAYVADGAAGLRVINIADLSNLWEESFYETGNYWKWAQDVVVRDDYAYVAYEDDGLRIINISNPAAPFEEGFNDEGFYAYDVAISGNYAYVAESVRFRVIDISDPTTPVQVASRFSRQNNFMGVVVSGNLVYLANGGRGVWVRDVSNPEDPSVVGRHPTGHVVYDVAVRDNYAYVVNERDGLRVIDISNPADPRSVGRCDTPSQAHDVAVSGDYAYVADGIGDLRVINISDPMDPQEVAVFETEAFGSANGVVVRDNYAYLAYEGLRVVNISNPESPFEEGFCAPSGAAFAVAVSGDYAYLAENRNGGLNGLRVINISDLQAPFEVGSFDTGYKAYDVAVSGDYAYVIDLAYGLRVIDVSNPEVPFEVGYYDPDGASTDSWSTGVAVKGNHVYIAYGNLGVRVIDVSNPAAPLEVAFYDTKDAQNVTVHGDYVYVADRDNGLFILKHIVPGVTGAYLDIKPGSCPNPINTNIPHSSNANGGVLPVAVLGSEEFDVYAIDISSLELEGVSPLRHGYKDIAAPPDSTDECACSEAGPDGYTDLTLKFARMDIVAGLGKVSGNSVPLTLTGQMMDGTPIELTNCVKIVPKKGNEGPRYNSSNELLITKLESAVPNPFNPVTHIRYQLMEQGYTSLKVYDVVGRLVATLVDGDLPGGQHEATWDAKGMPSGVYFYRLTAGNFSETRKMVLLK